MKRWITGSVLTALLAVGATTAAAGTLTAQAAYEGNEEPRGRAFFEENVERSVENIENGAIITLTTENETLLERLHTPKDDKRQGPEGIEHNVEVLDNGVEITVTSDDPEQVEKIQEHALEGPRHRHHRARNGDHEKPSDEENTI